MRINLKFIIIEITTRKQRVIKDIKESGPLLAISKYKQRYKTTTQESYDYIKRVQEGMSK